MNGLMVSFLAGWPAVARLSARLPARAAKADVEASASIDFKSTIDGCDDGQ